MGGGMKYNNHKRSNQPLNKVPARGRHPVVRVLDNFKGALIFGITWILVAVNCILIFSLIQHNTIRPGGVPDLRIKPILKVEILNGCGENGLANRFAGCLRQNRYQITAVGNVDGFNFSSSAIMVRGKDIDVDKQSAKEKLIRDLQELLQIPDDRVMPIRQDGNPADVTLVIGYDYTSLGCYKDN
jgi:hypothetical protein